MFKKIFALLALLLSIAVPAFAGTIPTTSSNNIWTGNNNFLYGRLTLGATPLNCVTSGQYMTGFNYDFTPICQSITGAGVSTINGANGAITLANGTSINIVQSPSGTFTVNCVGCSGGTGSGTVAAGAAYQFPYYAGAGTTISPHPQLWSLDSTMSLSQINTLIGNLNCGACDGTYNTILIPDGVSFQPWTNYTQGFPAANPGTGMADLRTGTHYQQMSIYGLVPDAVQVQASITATSTTVTVNPFVQPFVCPGNSFPCTSGGDVGKIMPFGGWVGDYYNGTQYRFVPKISSIQSNSSATLSTAAPLTLTSVLVWKGTDNAAAFSNAMVGLASGDLGGALATNGLMGILPAGYMLTSQPIPWNNSQSWMGQVMNDSIIIGTPATDVVQTSSVGGSGLYFGRVTLMPDGSISASQHPYTNVEANGATTTVQPFYRPLHVGQGDSNNPLAPGWCAACDNNYVANITQNSNKICVPTGLSRVPAVSDEIVFPYTPTVFQSAVTANTGTTCGTGFTDVTISPAIPNTAGYTLTQTPFYASKAAAGIQHLGVAIAAGSITYPKTITLVNPITPTPGFEANVAQHGRVKIGSEFYDYMGCSFTSPYTCVLRAGPSTTAGWAVGTPVVPTNPCYADYLTPYPVTPTVNTSDSTPSGAVFFPGLCGGNFGIASPDLDGLTDTGGSFFRAHLEDVAINATNLNNGKGLGCYYLAGNHAPYATTFYDWRCFGGDFGLAQGPASKNEWNIRSVGPTGDGVDFTNWSVTSAYILSIIGQQNTNINRWDAYSTEFSPFDGSPIGSGAAFYLGYTLAETDGGGVQGCAFIFGTQLNAEPENGSHIENPPSEEIDCSSSVFHANSFEGAGMLLGGSNNTIDGQTLSASVSNPLIYYGNGNVVRNTIGTATGPVSNVFNRSSVLNWGQNNTSGVGAANGSGQTIAPSPGLREPTQGYDSGSFRDGLAATPYVTDKEGYFSPYEFSPAVLNGVDPSPFEVGPVVDPAAPVSGSYVGCYIGTSYGCAPFHLGGFFGYYYIGQDNRVASIPYVMTTALKTTSNQTFDLQVVAADPGGAGDTCPGSAQVLNVSVTTVGGAWTTVSYPTNFTGHTGCILQFVYQFSTSADTLQVAYMDFQPVPKLAYLSTVSSSIENTACTVPALLGTDGTYIYFCNGTTVKRLGPLS